MFATANDVQNETSLRSRNDFRSACCIGDSDKKDNVLPPTVKKTFHLITFLFGQYVTRQFLGNFFTARSVSKFSTFLIEILTIWRNRGNHHFNRRNGEKLRLVTKID